MTGEAPVRREGLHCPHCGSDALEVKDSRPTTHGQRRRRRCAECDTRVTTIEVMVEDPDLVTVVSVHAEGANVRVRRVPAYDDPAALADRIKAAVDRELGL